MTYLKGHPPTSGVFKKGHKINVGRIHSEETRRKIGNANKISQLGMKKPWMVAIMKKKVGEKSPVWMGENAGYRAKHHWIENHYGQPTTCEHCQTGNLCGRKIHWANISGEYKRERFDWIRLCPKCHKLFDKQNKNK